MSRNYYLSTCKKMLLSTFQCENLSSENFPENFALYSSLLIRNGINEVMNYLMFW